MENVKLTVIELYTSSSIRNTNCHAIKSLLKPRDLKFSANIVTRITNHQEQINYSKKSNYLPMV